VMGGDWKVGSLIEEIMRDEMNQKLRLYIHNLLKPLPPQTIGSLLPEIHEEAWKHRADWMKREREAGRR